MKVLLTPEIELPFGRNLPKFRMVSIADNFLAGVLVGAEEEVEKEQGHHIVIPTTHPILPHLTNTLTNIHPS